MKKGFSLVELSIVLVILGLLTGGILGGRNLIKAAELRAAAQELQQWQTAVNTFQAKFLGLPGDLKNAEQFWGDGDSTGDTWNGDGNGVIDEPSAASAPGEYFTFWQQLALGGLIPGEYSGLAGGSKPYHALIGENVPASKYSNGGWSILNSDWTGGHTQSYAINYGNHFRFGAQNGDRPTDEPLLTPADAWNLDTKIDDGLPAKGNVIARYWNNACSKADDGSHASANFEASYKLEDETIQCSLMIKNPF